jgi:hypothetical protein
MPLSHDSRMRVLVGHANYTDRLSYFDDWLDAFISAPQFAVVPINMADPASRMRLPALQREVDAIVLLHSTNGDTTIYLEPHVEALRQRRVPLLSFVGNEVNLPGSPIAGKRRLFAALRPEYIATQLLQEAGEYLFADVVSRKVVAIPHALNAKIFAPARAHSERRYDIGVRAARYLPHLGDDDRNRLMQWFADRGSGLGLNVEISDERLDRDGWSGYLNQCRGTVSTEAGTWFLERDDATVNAIREYVFSKRKSLVVRNDSALRSLGHKMPWWLKSLVRRAMKKGPLRHEALLNEQLDYDEIFGRFFAGREKPPHYSKCISSRHFDAAGTKTCQIMFRGRFNDILKPNEHYLALEPDFSNIDDVLARFRDPVKRQSVVDAAFDLVCSEHTYEHRVRQVYDLLASAS